MSNVAKASPTNLKPDTFNVARIPALQPEMHATDLSEGVLETEDTIILHHVENLLHLWAVTRRDLPGDFLDHLQIQRLQRQPLMLSSIAVQHVSRHLSEGCEPSDGQKVDSTPWPTQELLKLAPVETMTFPVLSTKAVERLAGQEKVEICAECNGARGHECTDCGAGGQIPCLTCGGTKQQSCPRCHGAGTVLGVSGRVVQCRACSTRGTIKCIVCDKDGMVTCVPCQGKGTITCKVCAGLGQQKHFWNLHTLTQTRMRRHVQLQETWPINTGPLWEDAQVIFESQWEWPATQGPAVPLAQVLPADITAAAHSGISEMLVVQPLTETEAAVDSGLRLRILGTYLYRVEFDYQGFKGTLFVGGESNRIFPYRLPAPERGMINRLKRWGMAVLSLLDPNLRPQVDNTYVKAVQSGKSHISDSLCLGTELATTYGVEVAVTAAGYRFLIPQPGRINREYDPVPLEVAFEVDASQALVLALSYRLGVAHRDLFPKALALNHQLRFGRVAVTLSEDGSEELFLLVDRRPYATLQADHYYLILREIEYTIGQILATKALA